MNNGQAVCSCLPTYTGSPPACRPECTVSSDCPTSRACVNQKCVNPCPEPCGMNTDCRVINHSPVCFCKSGFTGDPFSRCFLNNGTECKIIITILQFHSREIFKIILKYLKNILESTQPILSNKDPCLPNPCGANAICRQVGETSACSCLPNYFGSPPNCRPECTINSDCPSNRACMQERCRDPCPGSCGFEAECSVLNHIPICRCRDGFTGDPFTQCNLITQQRKFIIQTVS